MNTQSMLAPTLPRMTADEYLAWALDQPEGRFELVDGEVVAMASERVAHGLAKTRTVVALSNAIAARDRPCEAFGDGMAVRVADDSVFEPDAQVRCGPRLPGDAILVPDPLIVVEVLSPSTRAVDTGKKLKGFFSLPSVRHYLVLDPEDRSVMHHRRADDGDRIETAIHRAHTHAEIVLDPPGLTVRCADMFVAP